MTLQNCAFDLFLPICVTLTTSFFTSHSHQSICRNKFNINNFVNVMSMWWRWLRTNNNLQSICSTYDSARAHFSLYFSFAIFFFVLSFIRFSRLWILCRPLFHFFLHVFIFELFVSLHRLFRSLAIYSFCVCNQDSIRIDAMLCIRFCQRRNEMAFGSARRYSSFECMFAAVANALFLSSSSLRARVSRKSATMRPQKLWPSKNERNDNNSAEHLPPVHIIYLASCRFRTLQRQNHWIQVCQRKIALVSLATHAHSNTHTHEATWSCCKTRIVLALLSPIRLNGKAKDSKSMKRESELFHGKWKIQIFICFEGKQMNRTALKQVKLIETIIQFELLTKSIAATCWRARVRSREQSKWKRGILVNERTQSCEQFYFEHFCLHRCICWPHYSICCSFLCLAIKIAVVNDAIIVLFDYWASDDLDSFFSVQIFQMSKK